MKLKSCIFLLCFFIYNYTALAETYYVSSDGNDDYAGTSKDQAWKTTTKVNEGHFLPGDSVLFEGGKTFYGKIYFGPKEDENGTHALISGTDTAPITFGSYGEGKASIHSGDHTGFQVYNGEGFAIVNLIFEGSGLSNNQESSGIYFHTDLNTMLRYVLIDNVEVHGYRDAGISIMSLGKKVIGGFEEVNITNSTVRDNGDVGIITYADNPTSIHKDVYVGHNTVYNILGLSSKSNSHTGNGILIGGAHRAVVEYCEAYNNGEKNSSKSGGPIGIWGYQCDSLIIQYNESHHNKTGKDSQKDGGGFDIDGGCTNCTLQYNYSHDNEGAGYMIAQFLNAPTMNNVTIRYNISENDGRKNGYGAIQLWSWTSNTSRGIQNANIYNNTVYLTKPDNGSSPRAIHIQSDGITNARISNNVFFVTDGLELIKLAKITDVRFLNNNYWSGDGPFKINWNEVVYSSLTEWSKVTNQELLVASDTKEDIFSGYSKDPKLKNPGGVTDIGDLTKLHLLTNYELETTSEMLGKGLNLKLDNIDIGERDFFGNSIIDRTSFSIGAHQPDPSTYPVTLSFFEAQQKESHVLLIWETASEQDNKGFEVQKSYDGITFQSIGFVASKDPDSQVRQQYQFIDSEITNGTIYYRLKQIDLDGAQSYSATIATEVAIKEFRFFSYPNPFEKKFFVEVNVPIESPLSIKVNDLLGRTLLQKTVLLKKGVNKVPLLLEGQHKQNIVFVSAEFQGQTHRVKMLIVQ